MQDEFILAGRGETGRWNHSLHPVRWKMEPKRLPTHTISNNILMLSTQFDEPFRYSTSSWVKENNCVKDIKRFRSVQKSFMSGGGQQGVGQKVNVVTLSEERTPYEYWIKSVHNPPHMKFTIPGNVVVYILYVNPFTICHVILFAMRSLLLPNCEGSHHVRLYCLLYHEVQVHRSHHTKSKVKTGYLYSGTVSLTATGGCRLFCSALPVRSA